MCAALLCSKEVIKANFLLKGLPIPRTPELRQTYREKKGKKEAGIIAFIETHGFFE